MNWNCYLMHCWICVYYYYHYHYYCFIIYFVTVITVMYDRISVTTPLLGTWCIMITVLNNNFSLETRCGTLGNLVWSPTVESLAQFYSYVASLRATSTVWCAPHGDSSTPCHRQSAQFIQKREKEQGCFTHASLVKRTMTVLEETEKKRC